MSTSVNSVTKGQNMYWGLCLSALPVIIFFLWCKPWERDYDFWETAATIRAASVNLHSPSHPLLLLPGNLSPRFVPYTIFWGFLKKSVHLGIFATMTLAGVANYVIFILGLHRFLTKQFKHNRLPMYMLLTMLFIWGTGYGWANAYQLEMFFVMLPYVGFFTFGLSLHALYYLNCYCEKHAWRDLLWYSLFSVICFLTHPPTGVFCFIAAFSMLLTYKNLPQLLVLQSIPLLSVGSCLLWPYFSYWDVFTTGTAQKWFRSALFSGQVQALGSAIIGFPLVLSYAVKKIYVFVVYGVLFCSGIYTLSAFTGIEIGERFIFFSTFFLHLAIALYLIDHQIFSIQKVRESLRTDVLVVILVMMLVVPSGACRIQEIMRHVHRIVDKPFRIHRYDSPVKPYLFLSDYLTDSDVVLATPLDGWVIPALSGARIVAPLKLNPLIIAEGTQRQKEVSVFFTTPCSLSERREMIAKYHVTHMLVNLHNKKDWDRSFIKDLEILGKEVARKTTIIEAEKKVENTVILYTVASIH